MTLLVGTNTTTSFTESADLYANSEWYFRSFTASESGNATALYMYLADIWTASGYKLAIWNSSGTLLAATSEITTSTAGWVSGAISDTTITSGQTYYLGFRCNSGYIKPYGDGTGYQIGTDTNSTYATPGNLADTTTDDNGNDRFAMYADGTTGSPTTKKLKLLAHSRRRNAA